MSDPTTTFQDKSTAVTDDLAAYEADLTQSQAGTGGSGTLYDTYDAKITNVQNAEASLGSLNTFLVGFIIVSHFLLIIFIYTSPHNITNFLFSK